MRPLPVARWFAGLALLGRPPQVLPVCAAAWLGLGTLLGLPAGPELLRRAHRLGRGLEAGLSVPRDIAATIPRGTDGPASIKAITPPAAARSELRDELEENAAARTTPRGTPRWPWALSPRVRKPAYTWSSNCRRSFASSSLSPSAAKRNNSDSAVAVIARLLLLPEVVAGSAPASGKRTQPPPPGHALGHARRFAPAAVQQ